MPHLSLEGSNPVCNTAYSVNDLLPHAPPMVLLDEVLSWEQGQVSTALTIRPESPFFSPDSYVPSYVGLEYMAQTCGIYAGIEAKNQKQPVRLGFLLGTRNFNATTDRFLLGDRLVIEATEVFRQDGMGVFDCRIKIGNEEVASAQLNLYQPEGNQEEDQHNG